ncbi:helix-turn-helix domain-containing protein [Cesiribacter andamanensis]|uniref:DNA binding domain, excisionase family n=1 Tax=Cesiribacter andamanensis AMV16 TaxID=1279009 RepID=M7N2D3_9BACT|nr:helix-turn-helix domain-containing protein [Cesiribacter andamanensis]EMR01467.1 DNA binding domain, excisionase family [Cesiribacter andamanensis AMV16]
MHYSNRPDTTTTTTIVHYYQASEHLLSISQVCERLSCSKPVVYTLIKEGQLPAVQHLSQKKVRASSLLQYIEGLPPAAP